MRLSFLVYGVLYVVVEIVGAQIEAIGWPHLTALDVATAVANACLTVAVGIAVLVGADVGGRHWHRSVVARREESARLAAEAWAEPGTITVASWRSEPLALPAGRPWEPAPGGDYAVPARGRPFPEDAGHLL
ncbi:hypothetical protein SAMN05660209_00968 [Geodermatophilus africanus]|uniref:Uncharacterized protein n=1 Tax=Geodermatophilus africanus TaxID=1137993 RepID=A0A1H3DF17_9ACTN|nr:hypothetical protein [Geodermatophilus africanus]SDX64986.1 hypothetical protein SAMN05660209_00968 [Geodermatophilus africanus]